MVSCVEPRPIVSPCQATESAPSRYRHSPAETKGSPARPHSAPTAAAERRSATDGEVGGTVIRAGETGTATTESYICRVSARQGISLSSVEEQPRPAQPAGQVVDPGARVSVIRRTDGLMGRNAGASARSRRDPAVPRSSSLNASRDSNICSSDARVTPVTSVAPRRACPPVATVHRVDLARGRGPWLLAWLAVAPIVALRAGTLAESDTFWQTRTGELILDLGRLPTADLFSWTHRRAPVDA